MYKSFFLHLFMKFVEPVHLPKKIPFDKMERSKFVEENMLVGQEFVVEKCQNNKRNQKFKQKSNKRNQK